MEVSFICNSGTIIISQEVIINVIKNICARKFKKDLININFSDVDGEKIVTIEIKDEKNDLFDISLFKHELRRQMIYNLN
jgi:broad specificity polyphosphatase/5'/3'-nucleotidase SurE